MLDLDTLDFEKSGGRVTVVTQDADSGVVLMIAYADRSALEHSIDEQKRIPMRQEIKNL